MAQRDEPVGMPDYLRRWRRERALEDVPQLYRARLHPDQARREGPARGLTQLETAVMAGVRERHYAELERRGGPGHSRHLVAAIAGILGLDPAQEGALYRWAQHRPPCPLPGSGLGARLHRMLQRQSDPALITDRGTWDVAAHNEPAAYHLPQITRPRANVAELVLGPGADEVLMDWERSWARPLVGMLRMEVAAPGCDPRLRETAARVRRHPPTRRIWDGDAGMREHADADGLPIRVPTLWRGAVGTVGITTLTPESRPDLRLVLISPEGVRPEETAGPGRTVQSAQRLADAVQAALDTAYVTVNYPTAPRRELEQGTVDVGLRRAAVAADGPLPPGFLRPGDPLPPLPAGSEPVAEHRRGGCVLLTGLDAITAALGHRPDLVAALVPAPDVIAVMHAPLMAGGRIIGSVEAWQTAGRTPPTPGHLETLRHLATLRATAMTTATDAP